MDMHGEYWITNILPTSGNSMAIGVHSENGRQFATWEVKDGEYLWAHYFKNQQVQGTKTYPLCNHTFQKHFCKDTLLYS